MKPPKLLLSLGIAGMLLMATLTSAQAELNSPIFIRVGESYTYRMDPNVPASGDIFTVIELSGQWVKVKSQKNGTFWLNTSLVPAIWPAEPR